METPLLEEFESWKCLKMGKMPSNLLAGTHSVKLCTSCIKMYMELKMTDVLPRNRKP